MADQAGGGNAIHPSVWLCPAAASTGHASPRRCPRLSMGPVNPWPGSSSAVPTYSSCPFIVTVPDRLPQPQITTLSTSRSPHLHPLQDPVYPTLFADQGSDSTATPLRGNYSRGIGHNGHLASTRFIPVNPCAAHPQSASRSEGRRGTSIMMDQQGTEYVSLLSDICGSCREPCTGCLSNIYLSNIRAVKLG